MAPGAPAAVRFSSSAVSGIGRRSARNALAFYANKNRDTYVKNLGEFVDLFQAGT